jgi:hypothetical protein
MLRYEKFGIKVVRTIDRNGLRWPERGEASTERNLGCNRAYQDLRGLSWKSVQRVADLEAQLIARLEEALNTEEEHDQIMDELYEDDEGLFGLDIGVASVVVGLSAAGCIPCSSCNAGAYGRSHHERYPLVAFFAKQMHIDLLLKCAEEAGVGLENDEYGTVVVYADDIREMRTFTSALITRKGQFRQAVRIATDQKMEASPSLDQGAQFKLSLD